MKVRIFAIRLVAEKFVSDQKSLNDFLESIEFIKSDTHFVESETNYWSVLVHYEERKIESKPAKKVAAVQEQDLGPEGYDLYEELKRWRAKKAEDWNIPSFMICHNSELLNAVVSRPKTIFELKRLKGFGDLKIENHGEEILTIINANRN